MQIQLNGEPHLLEKSLPVSDLLERVGLNPQAVLVELNGVALQKKELDQSVVEDGAIVEIIRIVAGG